MRRPIRTLLVAVVFVLIACAVAPASTHRPRLNVAGTQPMTVYGYRFAPHERVRVTISSAAGHWTRHVRAGRHGRFHLTFRSATRGPCGGFHVRAVGRSGRWAALKRMALPERMAL